MFIDFYFSKYIDVNFSLFIIFFHCSCKTWSMLKYILFLLLIITNRMTGRLLRGMYSALYIMIVQFFPIITLTRSQRASQKPPPSCVHGVRAARRQVDHRSGRCVTAGSNPRPLLQLSRVSNPALPRRSDVSCSSSTNQCVPEWRLKLNMFQWGAFTKHLSPTLS